MLEEAMDFRNRTVTMAYGRLGAGYTKELKNYTQDMIIGAIIVAKVTAKAESIPTD